MRAAAASSAADPHQRQRLPRDRRRLVRSVVIIVVAMSATVLYVEHLVDGRGAEGRPGPGLRLLHAFLRPVAYAGREDGLQPCALLRAERHLVIVHVDRLELALDDVDTE